jgi:hypothetical protein
MSLTCCSIGVLIGHLMRIKSGIKDQELPLARKQMLFIFSLLVFVILSIVLVRLFVTDTLLSIIIICTLALSSGIFALIYAIKTIKKNKEQK